MTVFLCDVNVWLALALSRHVHHGVARGWLATTTLPNSVLFCRATQQALLRLLTNAAVLAPYGNLPLTNDEAWRVYEAFASDDRVALQTAEPPGLERRWRQYATPDTASPKLWTDAYLAAFARTERCRMVTTDTGFRQFDGIDLHLLGSPTSSRSS